MLKLLMFFNFAIQVNLLMLPVISHAGSTCIVHFVDGKMIKKGNCERHDVSGIFDDIRRKAESEIHGCNLISNGLCFIMKIFENAGVNLTTANETCLKHRGRLANIKEQQISRLGAKELDDRQCSGVTQTINLFYTGLTYQNREIYDSYGNTVKYSSFMIQDSKHEKLPLAVDICASDAGSVLYRRSFAIENGTLIFGVLCEVEL